MSKTEQGIALIPGASGASRTMEQVMSNYVSHPGSVMRYVDAPNLSISAAGTTFAYRDIGPRTGVPLILLNHWGAVLDNFDPRIVDGLASKHRDRKSVV